MIRRTLDALGRFLAGLLPRAPEVDTWAALNADAQREQDARLARLAARARRMRGEHHRARRGG